MVPLHFYQLLHSISQDNYLELGPGVLLVLEFSFSFSNSSNFIHDAATTTVEIFVHSLNFGDILCLAFSH